ncbi:MAG: hypothetical protein ACR2LC_04545 [Pyrinomonadaceae bacterium]
MICQTGVSGAGGRRTSGISLANGSGLVEKTPGDARKCEPGQG